jgi:hypothetical protein
MTFKVEIQYFDYINSPGIENHAPILLKTDRGYVRSRYPFLDLG